MQLVNSWNLGASANEDVHESSGMTALSTAGCVEKSCSLAELIKQLFEVLKDV